MSKWLVIGAGPSLADTDFSVLEIGWNILVINCAWELVPWADRLYAGDADWWDAYGEKAKVFKGQKWTRDIASARKYGLKIVASADEEGLCRIPGRIHRLGNSGSQGVNCVYHWGAKSIVLLGFDMHRNAGAHFNGDHPVGMVNASSYHMPIWRRMFKRLAADLKADGVQIVNATPGTALTCIPCMPLHEALQC